MTQYIQCKCGHEQEGEMPAEEVVCPECKRGGCWNAAIDQPMTTKHTKGKLETHIGPTDSESARLTIQVLVRPEFGKYTIQECEANAAHLVACWNALVGKNPEAVGEVIATVNKLIADYGSGLAKFDPHRHVLVESVREALAKLPEEE